MKKIESFLTDHTVMEKGIFISRRDGDITTFDIRMRRPYRDPVLTEIEIHSLEHLLATAIRNGPRRDKVIYVGPMGCATGFYVLYRGISDEAAIADILAGFAAVESMTEMPGDTETECGNRYTLDLGTGKRTARAFLRSFGG